MGSRPDVPTRICPSCKVEFTPEPGTRQTYCAPACRLSNQLPELTPAVKTCPVCHDEFTSHPSVRQVYCSPHCRKNAELRREQQRDQERALRMGDTPPPRAPRPAARPTPRPLASADLPPAATRNCPHCDQPVTIVALLATP
jgi:hypothetical protein